MNNIFGCSTAEQIIIPEGGNDFFKPADGNNVIRFLAGPLVYFESQEFGEDKKPVGDRKFYAYEDKRAKSDKHSKLIFTYLIFDYKSSSVKQWNINTKSLQKTIQTLNILNPDLSLMDCVLTKSKGSNGFNEYKLSSGQNKPFDNKEVIEQFTNDNPFIKLKTWLSDKIKETESLLNIQSSDDEFEQMVSNGKSIEEVEASVEQAKQESEISQDEVNNVFKTTENMQ